jgi:hypothetical protein
MEQELMTNFSFDDELNFISSLNLKTHTIALGDFPLGNLAIMFQLNKLQKLQAL